ncbi:alpha-1,4-glucan--maltose-1-phosphate maltosyltransferase [Kitasatospora atroaurantiaca]|uniref:Alpha-1,4-glucan:maltose-1-phosphate maltosyltransferase n=1 Tax=Kitasatospora atroaurantiaca TaxID=285545 RepID=A0A561EXR8_9ACTN|nr:alpha-1,4-glucan--maltose-1-phosphate maltosyltransferase [Kitasatospora atroaurantiaca]TWE20406.1 alpha-1,4-glucan:maltose-1-phosphate maltosyltransferase [Kitasatospora atroaurantiaca]
MIGRLVIDDVSPAVSGGRYPARAVVGEHIPIEATVWREGHDALAASVIWRRADEEAPGAALPMSLADAGLDRWKATVIPDGPGLWTYRVDAWSDPWASWRRAVSAKLDDGQGAEALANDLETGARLLERYARRADPGHRPRLLRAAGRLRDDRAPLAQRVSDALHEETAEIVARSPLRDLLTRGVPHQIWVDRPLALAGAWYELFPRSTGGRNAAGNPVHGTFATAAADLPRIADMGFDVVYLPPIHPIGRTHRKGPNNALTAGVGDVGSPWAIGSEEGGHDAVHPDLGTIEDFDAFVARARSLGLEVALDLAFQCSPDHPWVREHPEWFTTRPDGTIAFAENPPKAYQDIYPLNFDNDPAGLYAELLRVVLFWVGHGVTVFRVDNPHTKPVDFWHWLIGQVKERHPDVLFLAEAFTRPAVLQGLAKAGFTQSYTYFTWRTAKQELTDYLTELVGTVDFLHPNFFVTTPDILPEHLQQGSPAAFALRAALAALLSPAWGLYSGYELYEHRALHQGSEEYLDSEKYELRPRDWARASAEGRSLQPWITRLNGLRREHPALRRLRGLRFHTVDNDALIAFSKHDPATGDTVLCVVTLDPEQVEEGVLTLEPPLPGLEPDGTVSAHDALSGEPVTLGDSTLKIDPAESVARIFTWNGHE